MEKKEDYSKYQGYALDIVNGKIPSCEYIKKACKRYLSWFERDDMYFDTAAADRVIAFISKLKHFKGVHANSPFILEPWQMWVVFWAFGFRWKHNNFRVVRNVQLQVARKNGKSALCGALACYGLVADGEKGASVILAANSANQAQMIFEVCQKFLQPFGRIFKRYRDSIKFPATDSKLQIVSTNTTAVEGENASMYIIDEIELAEDSKMYDTLSTSTVARTQPLGFIIGTAGFDTDGFCYSMIRTQKDILDGVIDDDSSIGIFYEIDEGDDPFADDKDHTIMKKCNPNLGVSCFPEAIEGEMRKSVNNPRLKASVLMRHFDMWLNTEQEWLPESLIIKNMKPVDYKSLNEYSTYLGFDLSRAKDLTCLSLCTHKGNRSDPDEKYYFKTWYWVSQRAMEESVNRQLYRTWVDKGYMTVCDGNTVDYMKMYDKIQEIAGDMWVSMIGYDPYNASFLERALSDEGRPMMPYGMNVKNMNTPMKSFEMLILNDKVVIDNNPVTKWCLKNTCAKTDKNENLYPIKTNMESKIDGAVSMLISLGVLMREECPIEFEVSTLN